MHLKTKYLDEEVKFVKREYSNGRLALCIKSASGKPLATVSSNLPQFVIASKSIFVKTYSEDTGMLDALVEAGVLDSPREHVDNGFEQFPVCEVLI